MTLQQMQYAITVAECGSMNEASKKLYISQPSLSGAIKELEGEIKVQIFHRSKRGITLTPEGHEFLGYIRQVVSQFNLLKEHYTEGTGYKKKFSVSTQHYSFSAKAFVELVKQFGMDEYEFALYETKTFEIIENVKEHRSEIGIIYIDDFNEKVMSKLLTDNNLVFQELFCCEIYVYLGKHHPLAEKRSIRMEELENYPCLSFDQGANNSFYLAEEVLSSYPYKHIIKANDRATMLNLMMGLNAYTLCSGILCEELNGEDFACVKLEIEEQMRIGYITRKSAILSQIAKVYLKEVNQCIRQKQKKEKMSIAKVV